MGSTPAITSPPRRRLRFGLRTLLISVAVMAVVFGWVARARQQRDAVAALRASIPGVFLLYNFQAAESGRGLRSLAPDRFERVRRWLGVDYFASVAAIEMSYPTDAELRLVSRFRELRQLLLWRSVDVTDEGLSHLSTLASLKKLVLSDATNVSDEGLRYLAELTSLEELSFAAGPLVTGIGIMKLEKLKSVTRLELSCQNAEATAAVDELRRVLPNCQIRGSSADDIR
jgi:hypothetical protein